jgi:hypothetical protein
MTIQSGVRNIFIALGIIVFGSLLTVLVSFAQSWTAPTNTPPGGNVAAPINISSLEQTKEGNLIVLSSVATGDLVVNVDSFLGGRLQIANDNPDALGSLPGDALEVWGVIAMKGDDTDGGVDTRIVNVDSPIDNRDVATKGYVMDYVDAAGGGGGAGGTTVVTLWGSSLGVGPLGDLPVPPGAGTPTCSSLNQPPVSDYGQWVQLYAGYGPHHGIYKAQDYQKLSTTFPFTTEMTGPLQPGDPIDTEWPTVSGSTCSSVRKQNATVRPYWVGSNPPGAGQTVVVDACSDELCNTCRVCQFVWNPPTP